MATDENGFDLPPEFRAVAFQAQERASSFVAIEADFIQSLTGLPPEQAGTIAVHSAIRGALLMALCVADQRGVEPSRDRWMAACGEAFDQQVPAMLAAINAAKAEGKL
ncbi:hypothetical protein [Mesorhizobium sp. M2A.F.Ca.ET.039.01.1.1]|uniref:hypothetical protein n=1 Tax=Mesorhizobium sp. M2A.F.Ca.ET.039.01.1.1 TaxID=2496746 RepID=UPI000FCCA9D9|nr:hypothetical protein [Mesorhizobium sp. M2A.F.Ca.ET.039.01.1.1]RWX72545.1 hypothetical protein EOA24_00705 [Mesorhizobium sp. M2A.F.Ca.ET.039.01.1.1]